jgi:hypothetical protein
MHVPDGVRESGVSVRVTVTGTVVREGTGVLLVTGEGVVPDTGGAIVRVTVSGVTGTIVPASLAMAPAVTVTFEE